jgi:hypothetical protein
MRTTVEDKEALLDELKFSNDVSKGKETPLSPEQKVIRDWNKQKDKLDKEFKEYIIKLDDRKKDIQDSLRQSSKNASGKKGK